ncbi:hypothetical protein GIB67_022454 [Kingdonia uniflora]|uniref:Major facilitator superfamily (MFS) profile domain-containing protein n=1 Tax=Kingdonia uniflora TaxID=39325 RepID=A0A7J7MU63_9MAGN|nr:hypothetical protein GIB67_022454 [Kingdonia uniflora]
MIPGVIPFVLYLFLAKLVAYTFLYWLPFYLSQTAIGGEYVSVKSAGNLSTLFDVGGIVGGILAGYISDKLSARATTTATFMYAAIPAMRLYRVYVKVSKSVNILLMMVTGLFVNGPYALITTTGWDAALTMFVSGAFIAGLLLSAEIIEKSSKHRQQGIAGFGLACHLGVLVDLPTIGIGKNCGRIGSTAADVTPIIHTSSAMSEVATSPASD